MAAKDTENKEKNDESSKTNEDSVKKDKKDIKIKVEEVKDSPKKDGAPEEIKEKDKTPEEKETKDTQEVPSFSMLDADEKEKDVKNSEKEKVSEEDKDKKKEEISSEEVKKWLKDIKPEVESDEDHKPKKGSKGKVFLVIFIIIAILGAIAGGVYYYHTNVSNIPLPQPAPTPTLTPQEPTATPTPTEAEEVDLTQYTINVLNGSGIPGEAGNVSDFLEEAGFEGIDTGNADSYDYENTIISFKEGVPASVFDEISDSIGETYTLELSEEPLSEDSDYDIVITVGARS